MFRSSSILMVQWCWDIGGGAQVEFLQPGSWREALEARAAYPGAKPIWGGTDVMVELNFDRERPPYLLDLTRVPELKEWWTEDRRLRVGAGVTYTQAIEELEDRLPGLAIASRTVGPPRPRHSTPRTLRSKSPRSGVLAASPWPTSSPDRRRTYSGRTS